MAQNWFKSFQNSWFGAESRMAVCIWGRLWNLLMGKISNLQTIPHSTTSKSWAGRPLRASSQSPYFYILTSCSSSSIGRPFFLHSRIVSLTCLANYSHNHQLAYAYYSYRHVLATFRFPASNSIPSDNVHHLVSFSFFLYGSVGFLIGNCHIDGGLCHQLYQMLRFTDPCHPIRIPFIFGAF